MQLNTGSVRIQFANLKNLSSLRCTSSKKPSSQESKVYCDVKALEAHLAVVIPGTLFCWREPVDFC